MTQCRLQLCSDAVELSCDTVTIDTVSHDLHCADGLAPTQLKSNMAGSGLMSPDVASPGSDRAFLTCLTDSAGLRNVSATEPVAAGGVNMPLVSTQQQRGPKSLDQEFTLLNLDIPNVTIHSVSRSVLWFSVGGLLFLKLHEFYFPLFSKSPNKGKMTKDITWQTLTADLFFCCSRPISKFNRIIYVKIIDIDVKCILFFVCKIFLLLSFDVIVVCVLFI